MKKLLIVLVTSLMFISLVGCTNNNGLNDGEITNPNRVFRVLDNWEKSGIGSHYNSGTNIGPLAKFSVEGLYQYIRSTDEIIPMLASDLPVHSVDGLSTTIHIRDNAYWQNGERFTSKDVWSYYYLNHTTLTNYLLSVETPDDETVVLNWNPNRVPVNDVKNLLIAQDVQGIAAFSEFRTYANEAFRIVSESADIPSDSTTWGAFNKFSTGDLLLQLTANFNAYKAHISNWFVGTGPFQLTTESATQLILSKNPLHWNADQIGFDRIEVYSSSDTNQSFGLLSNNQIDYMDGLASIDTLEAILNQNQQMVHLKMYDPGAIGVLFNMEKPIWQYKVRLAFQYLFDREEIKNAANPYAITSWYPLLGMAESEAQRWMSEEGFDALPSYTYDQTLATQLLNEAGWEKSNGKWYDENDDEVNLVIGTVRDHPGQSQSALAMQAILTNFGITASVKMTDHSAWYASASMDNSTYDMSVYWTDLNMSFSYPTGTYKYFDSLMADVIHVNRFPSDYSEAALANAINELFDATGSQFADGNGQVNFSTYINSMFTYEGQDLNELIDVYNLGISNNLWGIQFYQNVTGSFLNASRIIGVPLEDYWRVDRNVSYVPEFGTEGFYEVARTNLIFGNGAIITQGYYQPNA